MGGRPGLSGAVQLTKRFMAESGSVETTGAAGRSGGSSTSVISMSTAIVALFMLGSLALTVTR